MKVENQGIEAVKHPRAKKTRPADKLTSPPSAHKPAGLGGLDQVSLSDVGRLLVKARTALERTALEEEDQVRIDGLQALRNQIKAGAYQIPIEELAWRLFPFFTRTKG